MRRRADDLRIGRVHDTPAVEGDLAAPDVEPIRMNVDDRDDVGFVTR